jgi:hypothetical protein
MGPAQPPARARDDNHPIRERHAGPALEHVRIRLTSTAINMLAKTKSSSVIASLPEANTL